MPEPDPITFVCYQCHHAFSQRASDVHQVTVVAVETLGEATVQTVCPECWVEIWRDLQPPAL